MTDGRWLEVYMFCWLQRIYDVYQGSTQMFDYIINACDLAGISETPINDVIYMLRNAYEVFAPTQEELVYYDQKYGDEYYNLREFLGITAQTVYLYKTRDFNPRKSNLKKETIDALNTFVITLNRIGGTTLCKKKQK